MRLIPLVLLFALAGCSFEKSQPAPVADPDAWGRLDPDAAPSQPPQPPQPAPPRPPAPAGQAPGRA